MGAKQEIKLHQRGIQGVVKQKSMNTKKNVKRSPRGNSMDTKENVKQHWKKWSLILVIKQTSYI